MFKSWRNEKKKVKAVFKLQFQATQVPQLKKPALIISLVPDDVGKPTFKLEKAAVQDGSCSWENPLYITVKLIREPKTGKVHEKIYHFIVSSGSSKSGYLGESSIDFADFAEQTDPTTISLPLKFANSGAVLHVNIQKVEGGIDNRDDDDNGKRMPNVGTLQHQMSNDENFGDISEQPASLAPISANGSFNSTPGENPMLHNRGVENDRTKKGPHRMSSTDWSMDSASDHGSLADSPNSPRENFRSIFHDNSDETMEKLKSEISGLRRQSELSELELESLRKQIFKESKKTQDLSVQVIDLKEERDALITECEQLKSSRRSVDVQDLNRLRAEKEELRIQLREIRREINQEKELNTNLKMQLQKTQDSNSELILAVQDLDEMVEQKTKEIFRLSDELEMSRDAYEARETLCKCNKKENGDQQDDNSELNVLNQKIADLSYEVEVHLENREKLEKYIEQLTQDYEDLKQENHALSAELEQNKLQQLNTENELLGTIEKLESQVARFEEKLQKQAKELSQSLISINELESQVKGLEKEHEKQAQGFEYDLDAMTRAKIEQEQKAIHAEEALRKMRWKNAATAERLQEEFKKLSVEMAGKFDENEKVTAKALADVDELSVQKRVLQEELQKVYEELDLIKEQNRVKVTELSTQLDLTTKQIEQMSVEIGEKSKQLGFAEKCGDEKEEAFAREIQMLKSQIEKLTKENNTVYEQAQQKVKLREETEQMRNKETHKQLERLYRERDELERIVASTKKEAENVQKELISLSKIKDKKESMVTNLLSEVESTRARQIELTSSLSKEKLEEENLQKEVLQLKGELHKREGSSIKLVKQVETNNGKTMEKETRLTPIGRDGNEHTDMLNQIEQLKERNESMETELKQLQERYSEISLRFAEVEGERQQLVMTVRSLKNRKNN